MSADDAVGSFNGDTGNELTGEPAVVEARSSSTERYVTLACAAAAFLLCGGLLVYGSGRGLDLTDEIFYLVWTRDPHAYALTYQPFGYLLHPLYVLVQGNLQRYRLAGFAITSVAGVLLGRCLAPDRRDRLTFSVYGAVSALTIYFPWIITPSYNSAANVAAMLMITGILSSLNDRASVRVFAVLAIATGLCFAAFSKPPLFAIGTTGIAVVALAMARARLVLGASLILAAALICLFIAPSDIAPLLRMMYVS